MFTQFRDHDVNECVRLVPFSGLSAIQKKEPFETWAHPDGHTYSMSDLQDTVEQVKSHFEAKANRPAIPPITFNLD